MNFRGRVCAALLFAAASFGQQSPGPAVAAPTPNIQVECVAASRAAELVGKQGCIAGKVSRVTMPKNGSTHLSICMPRKGCPFHAVVPRRNQGDVGDLSYLRGKLVAFVGDVTLSRGRPEIIVKDREQVRVTAGSPPPEFDAAQPNPKAIPAKNLRAW